MSHHSMGNELGKMIVIVSGHLILIEHLLWLLMLSALL